MSRVRGKKRMEIIKRFLEGEEDSDYEVVPTVTEGKYIVRPRNGNKVPLRIVDPKETDVKKKQKKQNSNDISNKSHEEPHVDDEETTEEPKQIKPKQTIPKQTGFAQGSKGSTIPKQKVEYNYQAPYYDPTISYQILEQLKMLGEEQRNKRKKKEQKKLVKHQIQKQRIREIQNQRFMARTKKQETESDDYYDYEEEQEQQQPQQQQQPQPQPQPNLILTPQRRKVNLLK